MIAALASLPGEIPLDPDADEARRLLLEELSRPDYQAAEPSWFDLVSKAFFDWIASLLSGSGAAADALLWVFVVGALVVVVAVLLLTVGVPRFRRRSEIAGELFGAEETRSSRELEAAAERAAGGEDWNLAIEERFRALARLLEERTLVRTDPGMTAHGFALRAARPFPSFASRLHAASELFDRVRYLGGSGTRAQYEELSELARTLRSTRPDLERVP